jgi:hypothetical protein
MREAQQRWRATAAASLTVVVVSACGSHVAAAPSLRVVPSAPPSSAQTQTPLGAQGSAAPADANTQACAGVQTIIAQITADTAGWSPKVSPYDQGVATRLKAQTRHLDGQAREADLPVREAVAATAIAFGRVAHAIMTRNRAGLDRAIAESKTAYSGLKKVCTSTQ